MSEQKSMNTIIHSAFRRDLARFEAALTAFPAAHGPERTNLQGRGTTSRSSSMIITGTRRPSSGRSSRHSSPARRSWANCKPSTPAW